MGVTTFGFTKVEVIEQGGYTKVSTQCEETTLKRLEEIQRFMVYLSK
jgi:hypothetical protein